MVIFYTEPSKIYDISDIFYYNSVTHSLCKRHNRLEEVIMPRGTPENATKLMQGDKTDRGSFLRLATKAVVVAAGYEALNQLAPQIAEAATNEQPNRRVKAPTSAKPQNVLVAADIISGVPDAVLIIGGLFVVGAGIFALTRRGETSYGSALNKQEDKTNQEETGDYTTEIIHHSILHISDTGYKISEPGGGSRISRLNFNEIVSATPERSWLGPRVEILNNSTFGIPEVDAIASLGQDFIYCKSYQQALEVTEEIRRRKTKYLQQQAELLQKKNTQQPPKETAIREEDIKTSDAFVGKGFAADQQGKPEEALGFYDQAISLNPKNSKAYAYKAEALWRLDRNKEALVCLQQAMANNPSERIIRYINEIKERINRS